LNEVQQNRRPRVFLEGARGNQFLQKMVAPQTSFFSFFFSFSSRFAPRGS